MADQGQQEGQSAQDLYDALRRAVAAPAPYEGWLWTGQELTEVESDWAEFIARYEPTPEGIIRMLPWDTEAAAKAGFVAGWIAGRRG